MRFELHPQRSDQDLRLSKENDILKINGEEFDFSSVPEGAVLPASAVDCDFIAGPVTRENGQIVVPLILPHVAESNDNRMFPKSFSQSRDGLISLPMDGANYR